VSISSSPVSTDYETTLPGAAALPMKVTAAENVDRQFPMTTESKCFYYIIDNNKIYKS